MLLKHFIFIISVLMAAVSAANYAPRRLRKRLSQDLLDNSLFGSPRGMVQLEGDKVVVFTEGYVCNRQKTIGISVSCFDLGNSSAPGYFNWRLDYCLSEDAEFLSATATPASQDIFFTYRPARSNAEIINLETLSSVGRPTNVPVATIAADRILPFILFSSKLAYPLITTPRDILPVRNGDVDTKSPFSSFPPEVNIRYATSNNDYIFAVGEYGSGSGKSIFVQQISISDPTKKREHRFNADGHSLFTLSNLNKAGSKTDGALQLIQNPIQICGNTVFYLFADAERNGLYGVSYDASTFDVIQTQVNLIAKEETVSSTSCYNKNGLNLLVALVKSTAPDLKDATFTARKEYYIGITADLNVTNVMATDAITKSLTITNSPTVKYERTTIQLTASGDQVSNLMFGSVPSSSVSLPPTNLNRAVGAFMMEKLESKNLLAGLQVLPQGTSCASGMVYNAKLKVCQLCTSNSLAAECAAMRNGNGLSNGGKIALAVILSLAFVAIIVFFVVRSVRARRQNSASLAKAKSNDANWKGPGFWERMRNKFRHQSQEPSYTTSKHLANDFMVDNQMAYKNGSDDTLNRASFISMISNSQNAIAPGQFDNQYMYDQQQQQQQQSRSAANIPPPINTMMMYNNAQPFPFEQQPSPSPQSPSAPLLPAIGSGYSMDNYNNVIPGSLVHHQQPPMTPFGTIITPEHAMADFNRNSKIHEAALAEYEYYQQQQQQHQQPQLSSMVPPAATQHLPTYAEDDHEDNFNDTSSIRSTAALIKSSAPIAQSQPVTTAPPQQPRYLGPNGLTNVAPGNSVGNLATAPLSAARTGVHVRSQTGGFVVGPMDDLSFGSSAQTWTQQPRPDQQQKQQQKTQKPPLYPGGMRPKEPMAVKHYAQQQQQQQEQEQMFQQHLLLQQQQQQQHHHQQQQQQQQLQQHQQNMIAPAAELSFPPLRATNGVPDNIPLSTFPMQNAYSETDVRLSTISMSGPSLDRVAFVPALPEPPAAALAAKRRMKQSGLRNVATVKRESGNETPSDAYSTAVEGGI